MVWVERFSSVSFASPVVNRHAIEFRNVSYGYNSSQVLLQHLTVQIHEGDTLVLLGRSGSGKTTTLKLINRLLTPSEGEVLVGGRSILEWNAIRLRRSIGYVIQEVGLFPHFSVGRNIGVVPQIEHWPAERVQKRVEELMRLVGLEPQ